MIPAALLLLLAGTPQAPTEATARVRIELRAALPGDAPGDPSPPNYRIRYVNEGDVPVPLDLDDFSLSHRLTVRDARGNEAAPTPRGRMRQTTYEAAGRVVPGVDPRYTSVPAHGAVEHGLGIDPERHWVLVPGERYFLTLEYRSFAGPPVRGTSNPLEFVAHRLDPEPASPVPRPVPDPPSGLSLELSPVPLAERRGRMANYRLSFIDDGRSIARLHAAGFWPNHRVVLLDAQGQEPPLTEKGLRLRESLNGGRDNDVPRTILPGETLIETFWLDLEDLYHLTRGKYSLHVEYCERGRDPLRIISNSVEYVQS